MSEKNIKNVRIIHKHDVEANWLKATTFVPKQGELIVYDIDDNYDYERFKIGDGTTLVNDLPFYACSWNDLLDRPFGYETEVETPLTVERTFTDWCLLTNATDSWSTLSKAHSDGCIVKVYYDDEVYLCTAETGGSGFILVSDTELPFTATEAVAGSDGSVKFTALDGGTHTVLLTRVDAEVVKVPEEYIPDTIARVSDIPDGGVQADMAQNDSAEPDYIKNRTHWKEDGELQVLFEGSIEITDGSGPEQDDPVSITIYEGMPYEVIYGGTTYSLVGKADHRGRVYIGSDSLWAKDTYVETEPPFSYGDGYFYAAVDGTYTLTISGHNITWHTIDKHYLPGALPMHGTARGAEKFNYLNNASSGKYSHAEGYTTRATGDYSHSENYTSIAQGLASHAEGSGFANGSYSHAEGFDTSATGECSHAEGNESTASETSSHAEGYKTEASGQCSHAEGSKSKSQATAAHAEGFDTIASGQCAHSEGYQTVASGHQSHVEGLYSYATGANSHAEGKGTIAAGNNQHVQGKYNIADNDNKYAHIVGNGAAEDAKDENGVVTTQNRSNAHTIDWDGNAWFKGDIRIGGTSYDDAISLLPKCTTITLSKNAWSGNSNPWSQAVTVNGVTANSRLELCPTAEQIVDLQASEITLMLQNDSGTVTAWAINNKPTSDLTLQVLITEVIPV